MNMLSIAYVDENTLFLAPKVIIFNVPVMFNKIYRIQLSCLGTMPYFTVMYCLLDKTKFSLIKF